MNFTTYANNKKDLPKVYYLKECLLSKGTIYLEYTVYLLFNFILEIFLYIIVFHCYSQNVPILSDFLSVTNSFINTLFTIEKIQ